MAMQTLTIFYHGVFLRLHSCLLLSTFWPLWSCLARWTSGSNWPLLDQFPGLTLLPAHLRCTDIIRLPELLSPPLTIAFISPLLTLETYCAMLAGSFGDVTYDYAYFPPQADEARTISPRLNLYRNYTVPEFVSSVQPKVKKANDIDSKLRLHWLAKMVGM